MEARWRCARGRGAGVGMEKGGSDVFPFSVPFVEFPCQSPAAESQPQIRGYWGRFRNAEETTSFPGLFLHQKNGLRTKLGTKAKVSAGQRFHNGTFPILSVLNRYWLLFRLKGNSAKLSSQLQFKTAITLMHASKIQTESHAFLCLMSTSSSSC